MNLTEMVVADVYLLGRCIKELQTLAAVFPHYQKELENVRDLRNALATRIGLRASPMVGGSLDRIVVVGSSIPGQEEAP